MINWDTVKTAIYTWVQVDSGLLANQVVWSGELTGRESRPFIQIAFLNLLTIGRDSDDIEDNPTPSAGAEILHKIRGVRQLTFQLQAFGEIPPAAQATVPFQLLNTVTSRVWGPVRNRALHDAGIGIAQIEPILRISGTVGSSVLEPRAIVTVIGFLAEQVEEPDTFIETAAISGTQNPFC